MSVDLDLIKHLVLKDIQGSISADEKALLEDAVNSDPEARRMQQEINETLQGEDFRNYLEKHSNKAQFGKLMQHIHQRKLKRMIWRSSFAAAVAVVMLLFTTRYMFRQDKPLPVKDRIA